MSFQGDDAADGFDFAQIYQYDYLGLSSMLVDAESMAAEASTANVFVAEGDEALGAVSAVTLQPEANVEVEVYALDEGAANPVDGRLVARAAETFECSGYHVLELDEPVELAAGERFSVVETIAADDGSGERRYQVYFENGPADEESAQRWAELSLLDATVVANEGESYLYVEGAGWRDVVELELRSCIYDAGIQVKYGNALIKAFGNGVSGE